MQRRVLLGAGAVVLVVVGFVALRGVTRHEAGKAADQGIQQLLANLPPGWAIQHGAVDYNPLTDTATLHDVKIAREGRVSWTADTLTISGADAQALRDVFDPAAYPGGKPAWTDRRLLLTDAAARGVQATVTGSNPLQYSIRSVTVHRLAGRPFFLPPTPENRAKPEFAADAALAMAADSAQEDDTKLDGPVTADRGDSPAKFIIASIQASNYDGGKIGSFQIKDAALEAKDKKGGPVHITIASVSGKDMDARAALHAIQQTGHADNTALAQISYSSADISGVAFDAGGGVALQMKDFHAEQGVSDSNGVRDSRGTLHGMTIGLGGIQVPPKIEAAVDAFGMRAITLDIDGVGHGKPGGPTEFDETITLHDLGTLRLSGAFSGYTVPPGGTPPAALAALMGTTLDHATLVWTDASLVDRVFKVAAAQSNTTPELIRSQLAMPILAAGVMVPDQPDVADQLTAFLSHPHTLSVAMNPPQKVTLGEVGRAPATERAHLLGLHITGN